MERAMVRPWVAGACGTCESRVARNALCAHVRRLLRTLLFIAASPIVRAAFSGPSCVRQRPLHVLSRSFKRTLPNEKRCRLVTGAAPEG